MFHKPRIAVDIDGVLADSGVIILDYLNDKYKLDLKREDVTDYWYENLADRIEIKKIRQAWDHIHANNLLINSPLMSKASLFNMLPGDITIVTHRNVTEKSTTLEWLFKNHFYRHSNVLFTKGPKSQFGKWDYFIEDCPENVWNLSPHIDKKIILFNHPYNMNKEMPENVIRVDCWSDIINFFKDELEKGVI